MLLNRHRVIFVFIAHAHQRAILAGKDLNNQVDKTSLLDFNLFSYPPVSLPSGLMKKTPWERAWRVTHVLSIMETSLAISTAE